MAAEVGITITTKDASSKGLKKAEAAFDKFKGKVAGAGKAVSGLPSQFGTASTALLLLQNSTSKMGGAAADAANKLTAVAALVATGGPIGIGIAVLTGLVAIGATIWEGYTVEIRGVQENVKKINELFRKQATVLQAITDGTRALREETEFLGETQKQIQLIQLNKEIELRKRVVVQLFAQADATFANSEATRDQLIVDDKTAKAALRFLQLAVERREALIINIAAEKAVTEVREIQAAKEQRRSKARLKRIQEEDKAKKEADDRDSRRRERAIDDENARIGRAAEAFLADSAFRNEIRAKNEAAEIASAQKVSALREQLSQQIASAAVSASQQIVTAAISGDEGATKAATTAASAQVAAAIAQAAAKAIAAHAGVPFVGVILGGIAAAASVALIKKFASSEGFSHGGLVTGGVSGRDSVPAMLTPGELVIPEPVVRNLTNKRAMSHGGIVMAQQGGIIGGLPAPQPTVIKLSINSLVPPSTAEATRAARVLGNTLTRLERRGMFRSKGR